MENEWLRAYPQPQHQGTLKATPEDFQVDEILGFEPSGEGEHVLLQIRKRNANSDWVGKQLAHYAGVKARDVGFSGLKDRHAVTTQWFSIPCKTTDWRSFQADGVEVLASHRHRQKLRRGVHRGNRFQITVKNINRDPEALIERVELIRANGVPNYFGQQRFGRENIIQAERMFDGTIRPKRHLKSIYLSAARAYLFNCVLSQRIALATWNRGQAGDVMILDGRNSFFKVEQIDHDIETRLNHFDIHPSGPLWGEGKLASSQGVANLEQQIANKHLKLSQGLEKFSTDQGRRSLRALVKNFTIDLLNKEQVTLEFELTKGVYATTVLRELFL